MVALKIGLSFGFTELSVLCDMHCLIMSLLSCACVFVPSCFAEIGLGPMLPAEWMVGLLPCVDGVSIGVKWSEEERDNCYVGHSI